MRERGKERERRGAEIHYPSRARVTGRIRLKCQKAVRGREKGERGGGERQGRKNVRELEMERKREGTEERRDAPSLPSPLPPGVFDRAFLSNTSSRR